MGNTQQSPKQKKSSSSLYVILPQKQLLDQSVNASSFFMDAESKFKVIEENLPTCRCEYERVKLEQIQIEEQKKNINSAQTEAKLSPFPESYISLKQLPDYKNEKIKNLLTEYQSPSGHLLATLHSQSIIQYSITSAQAANKDTLVIYQGQWLKSQRDGFGLCIYPDGSIYLGNWVNDEEDGHGRKVFENGDNFTGLWKSGKYHGQGIQMIGDIYFEGNWKDGEKDGDGLEIRGTKSRFEGKYTRGKKNGYGIIKYSDNQWYKGDFVNGNYEGLGEYHWNDGRSYVGEWRNNKMDGEGILTNQHNDVYKGTFNINWLGCFVNDKKEGIGMFKWCDGTILKGIWKKGQLEGQATITKPDGESSIVEYKNGAKSEIQK